MLKKNAGITLIALIITIIILLILALVTIRTISGDGIISKSRQAKEEYEHAQEKEKGILEKLEEILLSKGASEGENDSTEGENSEENNEDGMISKKQSYTGYYADINSDGTVDGVIYADLTAGNYYEVNKVKDVKNYYISQTNYEGSFGKNDVLCATGDGNERFYVMALTDFGTGIYHWYDAAKNMEDYKTTTSTKFGTGRTNTKNMIQRWDNKAYGDQDTGLLVIRVW